MSLSRNHSIFDVFSDFDDRFSKRMKRFENLADKMFRHFDLDPFTDLFCEENSEQEHSRKEQPQKKQETQQNTNQQSSSAANQNNNNYSNNNNSNQQKQEKQRKQKRKEEKQKSQKQIQNIKENKNSIFDLFSHYDRLFNERMKRFDSMTEKMFERLGKDYFGNEIYSERRIDNKKPGENQMEIENKPQTDPKVHQPSQSQEEKKVSQHDSNKVSQEQQSIKNENKSESKESCQSCQNCKQEKRNQQLDHYLSPFDIFSDFDKMFKERMERFERLTEKMFDKFEPQFLEEKSKQDKNKKESTSEKKDNNSSNMQIEPETNNSNNSQNKTIKEKSSDNFFFRPFRFLDQMNENDFKPESFSKDHLKMVSEQKNREIPSQFYSNSYSCVSKLDKEGKKITEERQTHEYTERDEKGSVITQSKHKVNNNGDQMEIEERMLDGKGIKKIVSKAQDGKCEEKILLHNMKNEDIDGFENQWKNKDNESKFCERANKINADAGSNQKAIKDN